jgi:hypothetical protein
VKYEPTTAPGARLPSTFLRDGSALYDRLGPWFTLLVFGGADPSPLIDSAPAPLDTVMVDDPAWRRSTRPSWCWCGPTPMSPGAAMPAPTAAPSGVRYWPEIEIAI